MSKRAFILAPLQIAQAVVGFGAIAAFTRLMSPEDFGRYALALSASMLAHTLVFTWAEAAAYRFFASAKAERRLRDHFATLLLLAAILGVAALALTAALLFAFDLSKDMIAISVFAAGAAVLRFFTRMIRETERAASAIGRYAFAETAYVALGFAAGVALLTTLDLGPAAPFAGLMLAGLVVFIIDAPRLFARARGGAASIARVGAYAGYGAPLALAVAVDLAVQTGARFIIAHEASPAALGAYAAAFGLARPLDLIFMWAGAALMPSLLRAYEEKGADAARSAARDSFTTLAPLALPAAIGLVLVAEPLSSLLIGQALAAEAARVLPWLALTTLISGFNLYYWSEAFQLTRRTGLRALVMLTPGAVQLALTFILAPALGALGGAIAALAAACIAFALLVGIGRRLIALPLPLDTVLRTAAATLAMALAVLAIPDFGAATLAAKVLAGAIAYAIVACALDIAGIRARALSLFTAIAVRFAPAPITDQAQ